MLTPTVRGARIIGTRVLVVTVECRTGDAGPTFAVVSGGACVAIVTASIVGHMCAAKIGAAVVIGARVAIIAICQLASLAPAICAEVPEGTRITILAGVIVGGVTTAIRPTTTIVCAWIVIAAIGRYATSATPLLTAFADGAGVVVVAS